MNFAYPTLDGYEVLVDEDGYDLLLLADYEWRTFRPSPARAPHLRYAVSRIPGTHSPLYMHRFITGARPGEYVDHADRNGLNNTSANLRICTSEQNAANRPVRRNSKTGYKGIRKQGRKYLAQISVNRLRIPLGLYDSPVAAACAYDLAARKYLGVFARFNFPEAGEPAARLPVDERAALAACSDAEDREAAMNEAGKRRWFVGYVTEDRSPCWIDYSAEELDRMEADYEVTQRMAL